jgi:fatty acid desaturase
VLADRLLPVERGVRWAPQRRFGYGVNRCLVAVVLGADVGVLLWAPFLLAAGTPWATGVGCALFAAAAALTATRWSLIHEAIHGRLLSTAQANEIGGRLLCVGFGASLALLRAGHLLHHRHNRSSWEAAEIVPSGRSRALAAPGYYARLLGGLYVGEVAATLASWLPVCAIARARKRTSAASMPARIIDAVLASSKLADIRLDAACILALYAGALLAAPNSFWSLATLLGVRALTTSLADNCYHYGTSLGSFRDAVNASAPRWLSALMLDFNLHGIHHRWPHLAWFELRPRFVESGGACDRSLLGCIVRQLRGPLAIDSVDPLGGARGDSPSAPRVATTTTAGKLAGER